MSQQTSLNMQAMLMPRIFVVLTHGQNKSTKQSQPETEHPFFLLVLHTEKYDQLD